MREWFAAHGRAICSRETLIEAVAAGLGAGFIFATGMPCKVPTAIGSAAGYLAWNIHSRAKRYWDPWNKRYTNG